MDLQPQVGDSYLRLAATLEGSDSSTWERPSLCEGWRVREVVAHLTMPARLTAEQFGAELAAAQGDFQVLSDGVALRDGQLPIDVHLAHLRSPVLAGWQPPGGGAMGALIHAVVHGLDITNALHLPAAWAPATARIVLDHLTSEGGAARFGVDLTAYRLEATDLDWSWGSGQRFSATSAELLSLVCHRTLPDGRTLA